jgi:hypothetical protein
MKRIRISTLMLLVVIVALVVALVVERRRSNALLVSAERDRARLAANVMLLEVEFRAIASERDGLRAMQNQAARQTAVDSKAAADAKPAESPSR